jgi:hypothetical protein
VGGQPVIYFAYQVPLETKQDGYEPDEIAVNLQMIEAGRSRADVARSSE